MSKEKLNETITEEHFKNGKFGTMFVETYYINEAKKTVVCKIKPALREEVNADFKGSLKQSFCQYCEETMKDFVGKSVCIEPDEFDLDFGKKLAYDKAEFKMHEAEKKFYGSYLLDYYFNIEVIKDLMNEVDRKSKITSDRLNKKLEDKK